MILILEVTVKPLPMIMFERMWMAETTVIRITVESDIAVDSGGGEQVLEKQFCIEKRIKL